MNTTFSRRSLLASTLGATALAALPLCAAEPRRKKIALVGTAVYRRSHAQHFIDRFLLGYAWDGVWRRPEVDLVSLYIDQFPGGETDLARASFEGPVGA